jgi:hypothetical protein
MVSVRSTPRARTATSGSSGCSRSAEPRISGARCASA